MWEYFTDRGRRVMDLARESALQLGHDYIGTEHMLLGLIEEGNGVGADVLKRLGVDLNRISAQLKERIAPGTALVTGGQLPFTQRAKKTLDLMRREAHDLGHNYMGTEHLLLGLVGEGEGLASQVLRANNVGVAGVRKDIRALLGATHDVEAVPIPWMAEPKPKRMHWPSVVVVLLLCAVVVLVLLLS